MRDTNIILIILCSLTGCTYSVHPLLTEKELADDINISGRWQLEISGRDEKKKERLSLELDKYDNSTYDVYLDENFVKENAEKGQEYPDAWTLQLGRVQGQLYGQMIPRDEPAEPPLLNGIPVYIFFRVEVAKNELFPMLDNRSAAIAEREKLRHIMYPVSDFVELTVFTGNSAELQEMMIKHGKHLFKPQPVVLRRVTDQKPHDKHDQMDSKSESQNDAGTTDSDGKSGASARASRSKFPDSQSLQACSGRSPAN
jgi:hypothetical protein